MTLLNYALSTVSRFKTFAGIRHSRDDTLIETLINIATNFIERYCDRRFKLTTYTNTKVNSDGCETIMLPHYPISESATFQLYERDTQSNKDSWDLIDTEDYFIDYETGIIYNAGRGKWLAGVQAYKVNYSAGFDFDNTSTFLSDTKAGDLEVALWKLVQTVYDKRRGDSSVTSETIGDYSVEYQKAVLESEELQDILSKYAKVETVGYMGPVVF